MIAVLATHGIAALLAPALVRRFGRNAFFVLALVPLATVVWASGHAAAVSDGEAVSQTHSWVPLLHLDLAFRLDPLSLLLVLVVAGVGALVLAYCARYFADDEERLGRFAGVLVAFAGAMLGLVLADNLLLLYVFWELTTILSFLLVGHDSDRLGARRAAMDALIVTTFGGLAMLVGVVMLGEAAGTYRISELVAHPPATTAAVSVGVVLVLVGALSKSALVPFHFWLPAAMAAPTPVSAFLHAAAMVQAGVFLVARLAPGFADVVPWRETILILGLATMLLGALRALRQYDLKLLLAYGTVSQLGLLVVLVGQGSRDVLLAGLGMLVAHALYKAALFLVVGIVDRDTGTRDLRMLSGVGRARWRLATIAGLAAASMAGVPAFVGFAAKETAFDALAHGDAIDRITLGVVVLGVGLTVAYAGRFWWGAFATKAGVVDRRCRPSQGTFEAAPAVLAVGGLVLGLGLAAIDPLLAAHADALPTVGGVAPLHLAAWHGFGLPLALSLATLVGGGLVLGIQARGVVAPAAAELPERPSRLPDARRVYVGLVTVTERVAVRAARGTQSGSLPVYLMTILLVLVAGLAFALIEGAPWSVTLHLWDGPGQGAVGVLIVTGAILTLRARRRLKAVLLSGVVGYGVATLFVLQGAPDLALTQFLVETVMLVVIVLVLRRLPTHFTGVVLQRGRRRLHLFVGIAVGTLMATLTAVAAGARVATPVSDLLAAAARVAGGDNIVNMTLVDVRAWDTMGELAVLVVAATGVTSLLFLRRRSRAVPRLADRDEAEALAVWGYADEELPGPGQPVVLEVLQHPAPGPRESRRARGWLVAENTLAPERRSLLLEVVVRLIFPTIMVLSVYLLLVGHTLPGGGFSAGLVAGLALTARYLAGGRYELGEAAPVGAGMVIGLGLTIATGTAVAGLAFGDAVLQSGSWHTDLPVLGDLTLHSSTLFDAGVYLVVVGVVLDVLRGFGSEIDRQVDEEAHRARPTVEPAPAGPPASASADAGPQARAGDLRPAGEEGIA